ncbi:LysM peptidoglycan-binding domain-containing protein [Lacrimispora saccharolytica]|uniref:Peptidoglycan-binding lysin domain protein n=1 Tax=Lacrimispora saccharolytica (strain ATCC 35040 / DSM 2544 / NRCC 2533 / WM1) TaxID=610130 RepID=D9R0R4_LACSW|nr:LysM peptidoglycan-binding domain-containing protein [Lacrimispora saccharolytica]ADL02713.1 Peptidoglycan-binding lysin domain protein [[Clostridium] saccharolyticum WM1]QRV19069.1 LysM peptidoglycan-binding domain-containing protein [Lacrimispora saccharolytica]
MGELYNPFPKLPKNIRQIGERDQIVKLYVEDYVNTYLKRLYPAGGQELRVGLLLGGMEFNDGTPYIFIDGALEMEDVTDAGRRVMFSELAWKRAYRNMEQLFPKRTIQGWFICGRPGDDLSPINYWKQHIQYFGEPNKLMYLSNGTDGEENIYITSEDGFYKLQGYSIYYERNQMMQDYMVLRKDVKRIETDTNDKVIEEFRKRMDEHKVEVTDRHQTVGLLRGMCMAMSVVILAGGIVMFNNYERMRDMESVIASAIPAKAEQILIGKKGLEKESKGESKVVVEEAEGGVYPTTAVNKETMSETMPRGAQGDTMAESKAAETLPPATQSAKETATQPAKETATQPATEAATQPASQETEAAVSGDPRVHVVQEGETLYGICIAEYQTMNKMKEICELNGLDDENKIVAGQKLLLP